MRLSLGTIGKSILGTIIATLVVATVASGTFRATCVYEALRGICFSIVALAITISIYPT